MYLRKPKILLKKKAHFFARFILGNQKISLKKVKVSIVEAQVNLRGRQVIQTNCDFLVG